MTLFNYLSTAFDIIETRLRILHMEIIVKFHLVALLVLDNFLLKIIFLVKHCEFRSITDIPHYRVPVLYQSEMMNV